MRFSVESKIKDLYEQEAARSILEAWFPKLKSTPSFQMTFGMSLRTLCHFPQWSLTEEQLADLNAQLQAIQ